MDRREFLRRVGLTGAGLAFGAALPSSRWFDAPAATLGELGSRVPSPATLNDIEHVVILIQENRSYDHYFGSYVRGRGFDDRSEGAMKAYAQRDPTRLRAKPEGVLLPWHLDTRQANASCTLDVNHEWNAQHLSWHDGANDRFLLAQGPRGGRSNTMGYYTRDDLPLYYALADSFTLCDNYFCSVLGPSDPNRHYAMSGMIDPNGIGGGPVPSNGPDVVAPTGAQIASNAGQYTWTTMPERLQAAGIAWKCYQVAGANRSTLTTNNILLRYKQFSSDPSSELYRNALLPTFPHDFVADVEAGTLPSVSWLNTRTPGADEHPPFAPNVGERIVGSVVRTLVHNPKVWAKTVLFLTYDENGGFFDHVAPPTAPAGTPDEFIPAALLPPIASGITGPIGLGFRVPMLVISPFSRGGHVSSDTFDHTSMLRFLETRFGVEVPNLSDWRRTTVGDLTSTLRLDRPRTDVPKLPYGALDPRVIARQCRATTRAAPPNVQELPRQEH
jgi:phospholipase C